MYHTYDTIKIELLNKYITKYLPKDTYLCCMIAAKLRVHTVVAVDSIDYKDFYSLLYYSLRLTYDCFTLKRHKKLDNKREYQYKYQQSQEVTRRRAKIISECIHFMINKVLLDKKEEGYTKLLLPS